jgi:DNA-binding transcriptional LysR family regulator
MFEVRHLNAVIALAESLNYTRAAERLHITQSGFSKQISEVEDQLGFSLFAREGKKVTDLTESGRVFVEHARLSILHHQRALQLARAAHEGAERFLHIGHSPNAERLWISTLLSLRLPLFPKLRIRLSSDFSSELVGNILTCAFDIAIATAPAPDDQITAVSFEQTPLYAALPEDHPAADHPTLTLNDVAQDGWVMFQQRVNPVAYHAIVSLARQQGIRPRQVHDFLLPQEAIDSVAENIGVALLLNPGSLRARSSGVVLRPFSHPALSFKTCLILRADNESRLVNEFARAFLRKMNSLTRQPAQMELPIAG